MNSVFLGIGGNLGDRISNINNAIKLIKSLIGNPVKISSVYISEPWGFQHAKYFTNAVIQIETNLSPIQILEKISEIESEMKRIRSNKDSYEGRTMDIDILFFNDEVLNLPELQVPHKKLHERLFVLMPMNEIAPDFIHPEFNKKISLLLEKCNDSSKIRRLYYGS